MDVSLVAIIIEGLIALCAVVTLIILLLRGAFNLERRLSSLETKVEPFWDSLRNMVATALLSITPSGNPITTERWQYLVSRLQMNILNFEEAQELNAVMLEQQEEAKQKKDQAVLLITGLGLALLAILLNKK